MRALVRCNLILLLGSLGVIALHSDLQAQLQTLIDSYADRGFGIGLGYVDTSGLDFGIGAGPRTATGLPRKAKPGNVTVDDTYVLGSGTKPFVATAIMRLVDQGKVSLDDKAALHVDGLMKTMWNTTLVELFGPMASNITVGGLIRMRSGLGDFDIKYFDYTLLNATTVHSPLLELQFVANLKGKFGCRNPVRLEDYCTWVCAPGTCTTYTSANYILAGVILMQYSPQVQRKWQKIDMFSHLGSEFSKTRYPETHFPTEGSLSSQGLTTAGTCSRFTPNGGVEEMYSQDASTMGWCYGNVVSSPRNVARFFFDLLLDHKFVSTASLAAMKNLTLFDVGWAAGTMPYGCGLEVRSVHAAYEPGPPKMTEPATFIGHDGVTFGFWSNQGVFPRLNASITLMTNQDRDGFVNYDITCHVVKIVAEHKGIEDETICNPQARVQHLSYV